METLKETIYEIVEDEIIISRIFDAPREVVWQMFTDPEQLKLWCGPKNFTCPVYNANAEVGGEYHLCMRSPDGTDYWSTGRYLEVEKPDKLVMTDSFSDPEGNIVPAADYGMAGNWPLELMLIILFEDYNGKTRIILRHTGTPEGEMTDNAETGWNESLDKLTDLINERNHQTDKESEVINSQALSINPYLYFPGNTEEAFTFYKSVFGGEFAMIMRYRETPDGEKLPPAEQQKIVHIALPLGNGNVLMGTDVLESMHQNFVQGSSFYMMIGTNSKEESDVFYKKLSQGGKTELAMHTTYWGAYFGTCCDKFGIQWMINYHNRG